MCIETWDSPEAIGLASDVWSIVVIAEPEEIEAGARLRRIDATLAAIPSGIGDILRRLDRAGIGTGIKDGGA